MPLLVLDTCVRKRVCTITRSRYRQLCASLRLLLVFSFVPKILRFRQLPRP